MILVAISLFVAWSIGVLILAGATYDDDTPPIVEYLVVCGHCGDELCIVQTREQVVLESSLHHLLVHSEGASWAS